jgi:hypothetical protein
MKNALLLLVPIVIRTSIDSAAAAAVAADNAGVMSVS